MGVVIKIGELQKFQQSWQGLKAIRVVHLMEEVVNSEIFKQKVLNYKFVDRRFKYNTDDPDWTHIIDNNRIYELLTKGKENDATQLNHTWLLNIRLGKLSTEIGHRDKEWIVTQNWFFRRDNNEADVAAHWIHEYAHILGFIHDYYRTDFQEHSVPNALGKIMKEILEEFQGQKKG